MEVLLYGSLFLLVALVIVAIIIKRSMSKRVKILQTEIDDLKEEKSNTFSPTSIRILKETSNDGN